jgi:hypothetical protein
MKQPNGDTAFFLISSPNIERGQMRVYLDDKLIFEGSASYFGSIDDFDVVVLHPIDAQILQDKYSRDFKPS